MARYRRRHAVAGAAGLAGRRPQAASAQDLQAQSGSAVRRESHRRRRALPQPARQRAGALGRREDADPGARPDPSYAPAAARTGRAPHPRLQAARDRESVCRLQRRDRGGARPDHPARSRHRVPPVLAQIQRATPPDLALHLVVDNSSTHTTEAIRDFLAAHPRFHLHVTPTSASWLNAVETCFGQLERRALRRGVFTSVSELRDEIRRFIETHNLHAAKPFRWTKSASAILNAVERPRDTLRQETSRTGH